MFLSVPSHVEILGAYSVPNTSSLFVVFNDEVQLAGDIAVQDEQNNNIGGSWYGVSSTTAHKPSSVWAFKAHDTGIVGKVSKLSLSKDNVIADSPEKLFSSINSTIFINSVDDQGICYWALSHYSAKSNMYTIMHYQHWRLLSRNWI